MQKSIATAALVLGISVCGAAAYAVPTTFDFTGSLATYVVPVTGTYDILAFGGQGGAATISELSGGNGAEVGGDFTLAAGDTLDIVVGEQGAGGGNAGFGGGGTFVYDATLGKLLEAAGGGGGAGSDAVGDAGQITQSGDDGTSFDVSNTQGAGGTGGNGGGAGNSNGNAGGGGGGGYFTNGGSSFTGTGGAGLLTYLGGTGNPFFGGSHGGSAGGGGGGYSGGGGGGNNGNGGGGGSFDGGLSDPNFLETSGVQSGGGEVEIGGLVATAVVPEPASVTLLGIGLLSIGLVRRRRAA